MGMKLARVVLDRPFDVDSDDAQFRGSVLIAGKGRKKIREGGFFAGERLDDTESPVTDVELEDDSEHRRVFVRTPGKPDSFIPYERIVRAVLAAVQPVAAPVAAKVKR